MLREFDPEDPVKYEENVHPSEVDAATLALADFALALFNSNEFVYVCKDLNIHNHACSTCNFDEIAYFERFENKY